MAEELGNKEVILNKALELFADRGYGAVGVAEICELASVAKPTLYHYFGSKRGLLDAILGDRGGPFAARIAEAARYGGDVPLGLEKVAFVFARAAKEQPDFARLRLSLAFAPPSSEEGTAAAAFNDGVFASVEGFFRDAARDHGNMKGRSRPYAAAFIGTMDTYVGLYLAKRSSVSDEILRGAVRQFMYGIFS